MENLYHHLEQVVLRMDSRFCTEDGHLLKNNVVEAALALDPKLLHYLLADEKLKKQFFTDVDGVLVFDKVKFQRFVMNKQFLPDSYTAFKNKVGLTTDSGEFLSESREVVLSWPYKDCMLEGGQTKEDAKRQEIFWNETLAPEEVNRLTEPKALCNFRRYDSKGEHEATVLRPDDNLIIKGNNLLALYSLRQRFRNSVKLIYIDPPYNTGNDSFGYNDSFNHSTWLTFMKNRLEVAKELLRNDGVICIQCDDNEQAYLKVLLDNITGLNFINNVAIKMSEASGVKMSHAKGRFPKLKEYILIYAKPGFNGFVEVDKYRLDTWDRENNIFLENFTVEEREFLINLELQETNCEEEIAAANKILSKVKIRPLADKLKELNYSETQANEWLFDNAYRIIKTAGSTSLAKYMRENESVIPDQDIAAYISKQKNIFYYLCKFNRETRQPRLEVIFADSNVYRNPCDFWQDIKTTGAIADEGGIKLSNGKKPEKILHRLIKMITIPNDLVLDFFGGSGTTAAVAHKMNRRYISCEQIDAQLELIRTRLQNVINGDLTGCSKAVKWNPQSPELTDGDKYTHNSFVYCELAQANQQLVDEIMEATQPSQLQKIWAMLQEKGFLSYKVTPKMINDHAEEFADLSLDDQKRFLIECLDKNMLYIPFADMDDSSFTLTENDKLLTRQFYARR